MSGVGSCASSPWFRSSVISVSISSGGKANFGRASTSAYSSRFSSDKEGLTKPYRTASGISASLPHRQIEQIANKFIGQRDFELQRAQAWGRVAWAKAKMGDSAGCSRAVEQIRETVKYFPGSRDFDGILDNALSHLSQSAKGSNAKAEAGTLSFDQQASRLGERA